MQVIKVGINYRVAPLELREKIVFSEEDINDAMIELNKNEHINEIVIISTCNRTEIYAVTESSTMGREQIISFLADWFRIDESELTAYLVCLENKEAILHLFRLAAGLDSMVIGETQVLGQVKHAFQMAQQLKMTDKAFNELFKRVITFAKRAHRDTTIGEQAVSISYVAVELAKKIFGSIESKRVLILGTGETGELTLKNLQGAGVSNITVVNRTFENAVKLAGKFQAIAFPIEQLTKALQDADIVISSTGSTEAILTKEMLQPIQRDRKGNPLFLIDIAVPRDLDPDIAELDSIFLYDIDDLQDVVSENMESRKEAAKEIEKNIAFELVAFNNWVAMLDAVPVIKALQKKSNTIHEQTMNSIYRKMPDLSEREMKVLQKHTKSIIHQLLEEPIKQAKSMGESRDSLKIFQEIFGLNNEPGK